MVRLTVGRFVLAMGITVLITLGAIGQLTPVTVAPLIAGAGIIAIAAVSFYLGQQRVEMPAGREPSR